MSEYPYSAEHTHALLLFLLTMIVSSNSFPLCFCSGSTCQNRTAGSHQSHGRDWSKSCFSLQHFPVWIVKQCKKYQDGHCLDQKYFYRLYISFLLSNTLIELSTSTSKTTHKSIKTDIQNMRRSTIIQPILLIQCDTERNGRTSVASGPYFAS